MQESLNLYSFRANHKDSQLVNILGSDQYRLSWSPQETEYQKYTLCKDISILNPQSIPLSKNPTKSTININYKGEAKKSVAN